ncbi:carbohydrate ABC transporter permease [Devosia aquimaris]|uniref:carbohydrate ABC transporter permease n=1 Tax=Devosia aquimaris TaxID=2866214 RepID=UPI001CD13C3C|nr:carbohydrate ABC transporter permease [Devosia sp. CJK-A8-3]
MVSADMSAPDARALRLARQRRRSLNTILVDRLFMVAVYLLLITLLLIVVLPMIYIVASSLSSPSAVSAGRVSLWPVDFSLRGYEVALRDPKIVSGFLNSIFYTVSGTLLSVALTIAIAFPLSRADFFGGSLITKLIVFTMLFSGGLIPTYMVVRALGMIDTPWALIVPNAVGVWQVILATAYFRDAIPKELYEASRVDGAGDLRFLWLVAIPLAKPMIAVIALMYAIVQWNSYFDALIYLRNDALYPLQLVLRNILILNTQSNLTDVAKALERQQLADLLKYSLIVISTVPVLLIYPFVARHFAKGIMLGSVKG